MYHNTSTLVALVTAKTKVAPLAVTTIPNFGLCGTTLLCKLLTTVREAFNIPVENTFAWTDSSIVLGWINTSPSKLKIYVANRVSNITSDNFWMCVNTKDNPADVASRGIFPSELINLSLWWSGPQWLSLSTKEWIIRTDLVNNQKLSEMKHHMLTVCISPDDLLDYFSSYNQLLRILA